MKIKNKTNATNILAKNKLLWIFYNDWKNVKIQIRWRIKKRYIDCSAFTQKEPLKINLE